MAEPVKPWRVKGPNLSEDYATRTEAYAAARELLGWGHEVTVWVWQAGVVSEWCLYERIEPVTAGEDTQ